MNIKKILKKIKKEYELAITTAQDNGKEFENGNKAKNALIRSQKIINYIHEYIKDEFIRENVAKDKIYPPLKASKPELKIKGFLKSKNQDVSILPKVDLLKKLSIFYPGNEKILTVNIRSQLSSLQKNIDTLYERTFAEALNLHLNYPKQCLGEIYLIPTYEYDDKAMKAGRVVFKNETTKISDYIRMFQAINNRRDVDKDAFKYERICLLIVDFKKEQPKIYSDVRELIDEGLLPNDINTTKINLRNLTISNFAKDLLNIYSSRFDIKNLR
jgi:hypothetical protein